LKTELTTSIYISKPIIVFLKRV